MNSMNSTVEVLASCSIFERREGFCPAQDRKKVSKRVFFSETKARTEVDMILLQIAILFYCRVIDLPKQSATVPETDEDNTGGEID